MEEEGQCYENPECLNHSQRKEDSSEDVFAEYSMSNGFFNTEPALAKSDTRDWKGIQLSDIQVKLQGNQYPSLHPSPTHTVMFKVPVKPGNEPEPYPEKTLDIWDKVHVRMPHSVHSLYPVSDIELRRRWDLVREALIQPINSFHELQTAILFYNSKYSERWHFTALHTFFTRTLDEGEREYFFGSVLVGIKELALSLPSLVRTGLPLLRRHETRSISLSQHQVACLLANAFLCTFPRRNTARRASEYNSYPDINFNRLFESDSPRVQEKLKCLVNYFRRVCTQMPKGVVTYSRHYVGPTALPDWSLSGALLPQLHVTTLGTIEDQGSGMLQIDFANKFVGGGVLGNGCVQEEIRFVICPELIVARLFTECLDDTEALIVTGCERFNRYIGYSDSFVWAGDLTDGMPCDPSRRRYSAVVAVDAVHFSTPSDQYRPSSIARELNKAYAGFSWGASGSRHAHSSVATGNWGCGAFRGNAHLKALLQLMVAAQTQRNLAYFTFGNDEMRDNLYDMHSYLTANSVTVGQLWRLLCTYHDQMTSQQCDADLYTYLYKEAATLKGRSWAQPSTNQNVCMNDSNGENGAAMLLGGSIQMHNSSETEVKMAADENSVGHTTAETSNSDYYRQIEAKSVKIPEAGDEKRKFYECQKQSWVDLRERSKDFFLVQEDKIVVDDEDEEEAIRSKQSVVMAKRKISDYFCPLPKT